MVLAAAVCLPLIMEPHAVMPGDSTLSEIYIQPWSLWWIYDGLMSKGFLPRWTNWVHYPDGGNFFCQMVLNALLVLPLRAFTQDAVFLINSALCLNIFLCGVFAWLFLEHLSRDRTAAWLGSIVFALCPLLISFLRTGYSQGTNMAWLPLALWLFLRMMDRPGLLRALAASLGFAALCLANFYAGAAGFFFIFFYFVWHRARLVRSREPDLRLSVIFFLLFTGALCFAIYTYVASTFRTSPLLILNKEISTDVLLRFSNPDCLRFFLPAGKYEFGRLVESHYLGLTVLSFILLPLVKWRSAERTLEEGRRFYLALFISTLVLAVGPFLMVDGSFIEVGGSPVKLPFYYLFTYLPGFDIIRHPARLMSLGYLVMAALVALSFRQIDLRGPARTCTAALLALMFVGEYLFLAPVVYPLPTVDARCPEHCRFLRDQPGDFAIVHLPFNSEFNREDIYKFYQTFHHKKLGNGFLGAMPHFLAQMQLIRRLWLWHRKVVPDLKADLAVCRKEKKLLAALGFRYIAVDRRMLAPWDDKTVPLLTKVFGKPLRFSDGLVFKTQ
jgi:hypothetical protein